MSREFNDWYTGIRIASREMAPPVDNTVHVYKLVNGEHVKIKEYVPKKKCLPSSNELNKILKYYKSKNSAIKALTEEYGELPKRVTDYIEFLAVRNPKGRDKKDEVARKDGTSGNPHSLLAGV